MVLKTGLNLFLTFYWLCSTFVVFPHYFLHGFMDLCGKKCIKKKSGCRSENHLPVEFRVLTGFRYCEFLSNSYLQTCETFASRF